MVQPTTDEMNDITVFRELEKMKEWIITNCYGKLVKDIRFSYGTGEHVNRVYLTIIYNDDSTISNSFDTVTIATINTRIDGEVMYLVITMTNGTEYEIPLDYSSFVTIESNQTIAGDKLFVGDVQVPDIEHTEGESVQDTNKAVNERFFNTYGEKKSNKITEWGEEPTDDEYPSAKLTKDSLDEKQPTLISGQNIKTVNGVEILGQGDIPIATGGTWGSIGGLIGNQTDLINLINDTVTDLRNTLYPIGSIYTNAVNDTNPSILLGFGSWELFSSGKVMVGIDYGQTEFDTAGKTGGEKTHVLSIGELASHNHGIQDGGRHIHGVSGSSGDTEISGRLSGLRDIGFFDGAGGCFSLGSYEPHRVQSVSGSEGSGWVNFDNRHNHSISVSMDYDGTHTHGCNNNGGGNGHNNLQPYVVVYMWQRIE